MPLSRMQKAQKGCLTFAGMAYPCHWERKCVCAGLSDLNDSLEAQSQDRPAIVDAEYIPFLQFDTCCYSHGQV